MRLVSQEKELTSPAPPEPDRGWLIPLPPSKTPSTRTDLTPEERERSLAAMGEAKRQLDETVVRRKHG